MSKYKKFILLNRHNGLTDKNYAKVTKANHPKLVNILRASIQVVNIMFLSTGLFKGSTTTLDGIGLRPMPAERPKTLRKLKSVYDASPTESPVNNTVNLSSNGQAHERNINGVEEEVRRRSNTTCSNQSAEKSLSILSPFDEQVIYKWIYLS